MVLTDLAIRHASPLGKAYRLSDCHGLYIQVNPSGSKLSYLKIRFGNKEKRIIFDGAGQDVSTALNK